MSDYWKRVREYPPGEFGRFCSWDVDAIVAFYELDRDDDCVIMKRDFVKNMCAKLNKPDVDDFLRTRMKVHIQFDSLEQDNSFVCRFRFPCSEIKRRSVIVYLIDLLAHHDLKFFVEKVVFGKTCLVVYSS